MAKAVRAALVLLPALLAAWGALGEPARPGEVAGARADQELLIFAAASLTHVLEEIGGRYTAETGQAVKFSFASSATLARQIESGARADVFVPADAEWMDYVQSRDRIERSTRVDVAGNRLVLVAPRSSRVQLRIAPGFV